MRRCLSLGPQEVLINLVGQFHKRIALGTRRHGPGERCRRSTCPGDRWGMASHFPTKRASLVSIEIRSGAAR